MSAAQDFLNRLQIASPCPASWAEMSGDDRARFCASCEKHVYDFSRMTAAEGVALIREKEGKVCGRLWRRADGTVITTDCPVGALRMVGKRPKRLPIVAASLIVGALMNLACVPKRPEVGQQSQASKAKDTQEVTTTTGIIVCVRSNDVPDIATIDMRLPPKATQPSPKIEYLEPEKPRQE